jgi:hypothetical protein
VQEAFSAPQEACIVKNGKNCGKGMAKDSPRIQYIPLSRSFAPSQRMLVFLFCLSSLS